MLLQFRNPQTADTMDVFIGYASLGTVVQYFNPESKTLSNKFGHISNFKRKSVQDQNGKQITKIHLKILWDDGAISTELPENLVCLHPTVMEQFMKDNPTYKDFPHV